MKKYTGTNWLNYPSEDQVKKIAFENALLNEDQPIQKAEINNGILTLIRRDGVEISVEGSVDNTSQDSGFIDVTDQIGSGCETAWLRRIGNRVTLVIESINLLPDAMVFVPNNGYKISRFTDVWGTERYRVIHASLIDNANPNTPLPGYWDGGLYWNGHSGLSGQRTRIEYEWFTTDEFPAIEEVVSQ